MSQADQGPAETGVVAIASVGDDQVDLVVRSEEGHLVTIGVRRTPIFSEEEAAHLSSIAEPIQLSSMLVPVTVASVVDPDE